MAFDVYLTKTLGGALKPVDGEGEDYISALGSGEIVRAQITKARNPGHHRKFFGLLQLVFANQEKYLSLDGLRFAVTVQAGYVEEIHLAGDKVTLKPRSISWGKMDQHSFDQFYKSAMLAIKELLPQFKDVDLDRELLLSGEI